MIASSAAAKPQVPQILSSRELDVLRLMADGKKTKEIAYVLGRSVSYVLAQRARLMRKVGTRGAATLVQYAVWNGLLIA